MEILKLNRFIILTLVSLILSPYTLLSARYTNDRVLDAFSQSYVLEAAGKYTEAFNQLKEVYDQQSYEINLRMGWLAYLAGNHNESIRYYTLAGGLKPFSLEPKLGATYPLSAMGNWDAVVNQYLAVLEIAPTQTTALYNLGLINYNRGLYEDAEKYFKKVVNLYPFDYDGLLMLGWTSYMLKKYREAKVLFQKALLHTPTSESAAEGLKLLN